MGLHDTLKRYGMPFADRIDFVPGSRQGNVLTFSMRRVATLVAYCTLYEFEDVIAKETGADRIEPASVDGLEFLRKVYKVARAVTRSPALASRLVPRPGALRIEKDYELFFPIFNNPYELFALHAIPAWRERCRFAACFISEVWQQLLPEYLIETLASFDCIYLGVTQPIDDVARITGRPCTYLPLATDALRFSPYPDLPARTIDVCGIGRRSAVTHEALLSLARERGLFYYYDTVSAAPHVVNPGRQTTFNVSNAAEHRLLLANLLKRSRYFIANRARANEPEVTRGVEEIAGRFFEGAAAGAVMLGDPPRTDTFQALFDWPDAVVPVPVDAPAIAETIAQLDRDRDRVDRIRRANVTNTLLRHDWVHRLRTIFEAARLAPTAGMAAREADLRALARQVTPAGRRTA
jgi:glycosyl transferase family 1